MICTGKAAGILGYDADGNATLSDSMYDGTFRKVFAMSGLFCYFFNKSFRLVVIVFLQL